MRQLITAARQRVASAVNAELTLLYWHIGQRISTELLQGQRAEYGKQVVAELARQLTAEFGQGWSVRQLQECINSMLFERTAISKKPEATIHQDMEPRCTGSSAIEKRQVS